MSMKLHTEAGMCREPGKLPEVRRSQHLSSWPRKHGSKLLLLIKERCYLKAVSNLVGFVVAILCIVTIYTRPVLIA